MDDSWTLNRPETQVNSSWSSFSVCLFNWKHLIFFLFMTREAAGRLESETAAPFGLHNEHMCSRHEYKTHAHLSTKSDAFTHTTKWTQNLRLSQQEFTALNTYVISFAESQNDVIWKSYCKVVEPDLLRKPVPPTDSPSGLHPRQIFEFLEEKDVPISNPFWQPSSRLLCVSALLPCWDSARTGQCIPTATSTVTRE